MQTGKVMAVRQTGFNFSCPREDDAGRKNTAARQTGFLARVLLFA